MTADARLLLVDDHPLFRDGFAAMINHLRSDWTLDVAGSCAEALVRLRPDHCLAVIDINLPDMEGFAALRAIAERSPLTPRVIISGRDDVAARRLTRDAGGCGFISKGWPPERVIAMLELVLGGGDGFDEPDANMHASEALTARQIEVLQMIAEGCSNKIIERRMKIAARTVRAHLTVIFTHLGVDGRMQAVIEARRRGLVA